MYRTLILACMLVIAHGFNITILHTNDVHARIEQTNKYSAACSDDDAMENKCYGGVARRHTVIQSIRDSTENVLLLDGGDAFQGTLWFNQYNGLEASLFRNLLGYDAMALGNHEFDTGTEGLAPFLVNATFPVLSCNIDASNDEHINGLFIPSTILEVGGERFGIVGYTTKDTAFLVDVDGIADLVFKDEVTSIREEVNKLLDLGVNKIIVVGHGGYTTDMHIAREVAGIDMIIGGHTNTFLYTGDEDPSNEDAVGPYPTIITQEDGSQVLVVQAYAYGKYLGHIELSFNDEGVIEGWQGNPILLDSRFEQDPEILALVNTLAQPLEAIKGMILGESFVFLDSSNCRLGECNIGNAICDAIMEEHIVGPSAEGEPWTGISLAMLNGGGFRASIPQGEISMEEVLMTLPFRNTVVMVRISGRIIMQALEHAAKYYNPLAPDGSFLQFSGFHVVYNMANEIGNRAVQVDVRCQNCTIPAYYPIDVDEEYNVLMSSFMANGGDGFSMIRDNQLEMRDFGNLAADTFVNYITRRKIMTAELQKRIVVIHEPRDDTTTATPVGHSSYTDRPLPPTTSASPITAPLALWWMSAFAFVCLYIDLSSILKRE